MKRIISFMLVFTLIISTLMFVGCKENLQSKIGDKLKNTYLLQTSLSRFFIDDGQYKKTLNTHLYVYMMGEDDSLDVAFFGEKIVKSVEFLDSVDIIQMNPYDPNVKTRVSMYCVELHRNNKINLLYSAYKLSKLPGVYTVDAFVKGDWLASVQNDIYYDKDKLPVTQ